MEFTKDEIFSVKYSEEDNILHLRKEHLLKRLLKGNNFIKLVVLMTIVFGTLNVVLIYNFFSILMKM